MLDVKIVPNQRRPGVGLPPKSEARRAWLPHQSRFCPVLEEGSKIGYLVYPPLEEDEQLQVRYVEEGNYRFTFYKRSKPVFTVVTRIAGGFGQTGTDELLQFDESAGLRREAIPQLIDALTVNVGGLTGGVGLRGAYDFWTPDGWDTIYTGVLNDLQRPHIASLTVRVETDWFRQPTEFRYALQVGEGVSAAGFAPIGQVFFVPRDEASLAPASDEERELFTRELNEYWGRKPDLKLTTPYGGVYDHQYRTESRQHEQAHASERSAYAPPPEALEHPRLDELPPPAPVPAPEPPSADRAPHPSDRDVRERLAKSKRPRRKK